MLGVNIGLNRAAAYLLLLAFALLTSPARGTSEALPAMAFHAWLTAYTEQLAEEKGWVGVSTAVTLPDGTTVRASAGLAGRESGQALTIQHRLLGGSTGKTYVAALTLMLSDRGQLNISDRVEQHLGHIEWFADVPNASEITILSLLNHSSGIGHYIDDWGFRAQFAWDRLLGNDTAYTPEQMLGFVLGEEAAFPVGEGHLYSDLNYFLLGLVLEAVSGQPYYELVQAEILDYLDLADTVPSNTRRIERLATGYVENTLFNRVTGTAGPTQINGRLRLDPAIEWTGGGFATSPGDLARFYYHLGRGSLGEKIDAGRLAQSAVRISPGAETRYGMGVFVSGRENLGRYVSHSGWYPGYITNAAYFADHDLGVAIQVNQDSNVDIYTAMRELAEAAITRIPEPLAELSYDVLVAGEIIGQQTLGLRPNGDTRVHYRFTSQGKIADLHVEIAADHQGLPTAMHRSGQAFLYYQIDELFGIDGTGARWHSGFESGSSEDYEGRYYVAYNLLDDGASAPAEAALIAAAASRQPGGRLPLLPRGEARAAALGWMSLPASEPALSFDTQLLALSGLGFSPVYLWLDSALNPFAEHSGGSVLRDGWAHSQSDQISRQVAMINRHQAENRAERTRLGDDRGSEPLLIRDIAVYEAASRRFIADQDVLIKDGRIAAAGPSGSLQDINDARVLQTRANYLMPGLWDMHVHLAQRDLGKHLAWGVTTVRDLGNSATELDALHAGVTGGEMLGPHILRAGFIDKNGPRATAAGVLVDNLSEALLAVDSFAERGYQQIKLYGAIEAAWVKSIAERADDHGLKLSGHVPIDGTTERAITDGYDEVQHFIYLWLNFAPAPVDLELTYNTAALAMQHPLGSTELDALIAQFVEQDVALDPTLAIYSDLLEAQPGKLKRSYALMANRLPIQVDRAARSGALPAPDDLPPGQLQTLFKDALRLVGDMHHAGVDILVGTDHRGLPGAAMHAELELLSLAGVPNADVLYLATLGAAEHMGMAKEHGSVAPGKHADLLLLDANPIEDIRHSTTITQVVKSGAVYQREELMLAY
ncbi:MAG: serine hydrolase [Pseudomonadota bacterium]